MSFPIIHLDEENTFEEEPMGTKEKRWVWKDDELWLFKRPRSGTGERWAEKVACELALLLDLPVAQVEFATLTIGMTTTEGTICQQFTRKGEQLIHGNELLARVFHQYDRNKRYKQQDYRLDQIIQVLQNSNVKGRSKLDSKDGAFYFCGYIVLDAWIANTDRHHEN